MKIEEEKSPSVTYFLCTTIALFALSMFAIVSFGISIYHLADHFINDTPTIIFDRGGAFGFGGFIALFPSSIGILLLGVLKKPLTRTIQRTFGYGMVVGIAIMLLLPIVSSIAISVYAERKEYISCDEAEKKNIWPIYRTNYYTVDEGTCADLVAEVKKDRPFL